MRRDDAARVRPVVEQEDGIEDARRPGGERDRLRAGQVHHHGDLLRARVLVEERRERLALLERGLHGGAWQSGRARSRAARRERSAVSPGGVDFGRAFGDWKSVGTKYGAWLASAGARIVRHPRERGAVERLRRLAVEDERLAGGAEAPAVLLLHVERAARLEGDLRLRGAARGDDARTYRSSPSPRRRRRARGAPSSPGGAACARLSCHQRAPMIPGLSTISCLVNLAGGWDCLFVTIRSGSRVEASRGSRDGTLRRLEWSTGRTDRRRPRGSRDR